MFLTFDQIDKRRRRRIDRNYIEKYMEATPLGGLKPPGSLPLDSEVLAYKECQLNGAERMELWADNFPVSDEKTVMGYYCNMASGYSGGCSHTECPLNQKGGVLYVDKRILRKDLTLIRQFKEALKAAAMI